jgi:hypothetical protein
LHSRPDAVTIVSMNQVPQARVSFSRLGVRILAAGMLVASVVVVGSIVMHLSGSGSGSPATGTGPSAADPWGATQAGYRQIDATTTKALHQLPVQVRLPGTAGAPAGVYAASHSARVRYGASSHFGVYLLTVWGSRYGVGPRAIRARASACRDCTHNRLIQLLPGISAAVAAGGGHPSTVTWREGGRTFEVRGPGATLTNRHAVAVARAFARANA